MLTSKFSHWLATVVLAALPALMYSCLEELNNADNVDDITIRPKVPAPLIDDEFYLADFLRDNIESKFLPGSSPIERGKVIHVGMEVVDGVSTLFYEDTVLSATGEELFALNDYDIPLTISAPPVEGTLAAGKQIAIPDQINDFQISTNRSDELDAMVVKTGELTVSIKSDIPAGTTLKLSFSAIKTANGSTPEKTFTLDGSASDSYSIDLKDAQIDLTKMATTFNTFTYASGGSVTGSGKPIKGTSISCQIKLHDIKFKGLYGKFEARSTQNLAGTIRVGAFEITEVERSPLSLKNPSIVFYADNSFGTPAFLNIRKLEMIGVVQDESIQLSGSAFEPPNNPHSLNYPENGQQGEHSSTQVVIDKSNSNVADAFSSFPYQTNYRFDNTVGGNDKKGFVLDTSRITFRIRVRVPLHVKLNMLTLNKEYKIGSKWEWIKKAVVKIISANATPINIKLQVYFRDENRNIIDSLFTNDRNIAEAVPANENDVSNGVSTLTDETFVPEATIKNLVSASIISFQVKLTSFGFEDDRFVKIIPENKFKIKVTSTLYTEYTIGE